jgi:hypothetical protein
MALSANGNDRMADILDSVLGNSLTDIALRIGLVMLVIVLTWMAQRLARVLLLRVIKTLLRAVNVMRRFDPAQEDLLSQRLTNPIRLFIVVIGARLAYWRTSRPCNNARQIMWRRPLW